MTTEKLLNEMSELALGNAYQAEIRNIFQHDVDAGIYDISENEYTQAMDALPTLLSREKNDMLSEYENICRNIREYSADYGFTAGLYCGFQQYFTNDHAEDGGFQTYVMDDVTKMPMMQRHFGNYENIQKRNEIASYINKGESKAVQEYIDCIECAWAQRAHSASLNGFYCGYRAALAVAEKVSPLESRRSAVKLVAMEHQLGYVKSYQELEQEKEQAGATYNGLTSSVQ